MINQDYVRRKFTKRRRCCQKKIVAKFGQRYSIEPISCWFLVFLLFLLSLILIELRNRSEPTPTSIKALESMDSRRVISLSEKQRKDPPPPPDEVWEYVSILPKKRMKVKARSRPTSNTLYIMQCGAYRTLYQAEREKNRIVMKGFAARVEKDKDGIWHRVVLGPYKAKRWADRDKHKLQLAKIHPCVVWAKE